MSNSSLRTVISARPVMNMLISPVVSACSSASETAYMFANKCVR